MAEAEKGDEIITELRRIADAVEALARNVNPNFKKQRPAPSEESPPKEPPIKSAGGGWS